MDEHDGGVDVVQTESKGTATSASLYRMQNIMDAQETDQVSFPISIGVEFWAHTYIVTPRWVWGHAP